MRRRIKLSKELRSAIEIQNTANKAAKVESHKPRYITRAEANAIRRELKHDAMMHRSRRSFVEKVRQVALVAIHKQIAARKRTDAILKGLPSEEKKTALGIVLPSGTQVHKVASGRRGGTV